MDNKKNIILIGMMGCGKSTTAHLLDEKIKEFTYVDLDKEIEKEANKHIPEIFAQDGEEYFRNLETKILEKFCAYSRQVIATGGGIIEKSCNMDIMKKSGVIFYLKAKPDTLFERVRKTNNRPMLFAESPKDRLKDLLKKREPFYNQADCVIDTENKDLNEITDEIVREYENRYINS